MCCFKCLHTWHVNWCWIRASVLLWKILACVCTCARVYLTFEGLLCLQSFYFLHNRPINQKVNDNLSQEQKLTVDQSYGNGENRRTQGKSATAHMNKCNKSKKNKPSNGIHCLFKQIYTLVLTLVCFFFLSLKGNLKPHEVEHVHFLWELSRHERWIGPITLTSFSGTKKSSHFCCQDAADFIQMWMRAAPTCCHTAVIHVALYTPDCAESAAWNRDKLNKCGPRRACSLPGWVEYNPFKDLRCTSHTYTPPHTYL